MAKKHVIVCWCLFALSASVFSASIPSYLKICKRRDPNLNKCVRDSVLGLREKLKTGIPELNVPSIEPLIIEEQLTLANSAAFSGSTKNIHIYGITAMNDLAVDVDLFGGQHVDIDVHFDSLKIEGDYDINARILVPITAQGPIHIDAKDVTAKLLLKFKVVQHKGHDHVVFTSNTCKLTIGDYTSHFVPRPGQDQTFTEAINDVLNSNKQEIFASIVTGLERGVAKKVIQVANIITKNFTHDDLFPNSQ